MNAQELRLSIFDMLKTTEDTETLGLVLALLAKLLHREDANVIGFEADGTPITEDDFVESILQSSADSRVNGVTPHAAFKAQFGIHE